MWFVHPGIMAVSAALALSPVVIHLINRRRHRVEPWAATMFLLRAHRASQKRILLDHWLLLALRTLVLIALGVTIARPFVSSPRTGWMSTTVAQDRVIVLDDSLSMRARREDGLTAFDAARAEAIELLDAMKDRDRAALVTASLPAAAAVDHPVHDAAIVRQLLDSARCSAEATDLVGALDRADDVLSRGAGSVGSRTVYVFTDRTASSIPTAATGRSHEHIDRVVVVDLGPIIRRNLSLHGLRMESPVIGPGTPVRIAYRVTNEADEPSEGAKVQISVDGELIATRTVGSLAPRAVYDDHAEVTFESSGGHVVVASLQSTAGDALSEDDVCRLAVEVTDRLPVLLVEGDTAARAIDQSLFYLRTAVTSKSVVDETSAERSGGFFQCRAIAPGDIESELLGDFRVVVLGDVPRLSSRAWQRLHRFVNDGGGLVMVLGEGVDANHYNEFAFQMTSKPEAVANSNASINLKPQESSSAPIASDVPEPASWAAIGDAGPPTGDDARHHLQIVDAAHPIVADFQGSDDGGLTFAKFKGYRRLIVPATGDSPDGIATLVPLQFSTGDPALLTRRIGRGRVVVVPAGLTMKESSLPAMPDFVPFALGLTAFAAGEDAARLNLYAGQPLVSRPRSIALNEAIAVLRPDGTAGSANVEPAADALALRFDQTDEPGVYRMKQGDVVELFAVNVREDESDLRAADDQAVRNFFGDETAILRAVSEPDARVVRAAATEFAGPAMYLLVLLVLVETFVATNAGPKS